jgi:hypothetical protein
MKYILQRVAVALILAGVFAVIHSCQQASAQTLPGVIPMSTAVGPSGHYTYW